MLVMMISKLAGADRVQSMPYMNSGDVSAEHQRVVGYGAALFVKSTQTSQKVGEMKVVEREFPQPLAHLMMERILEDNHHR